MMTDSPNLIRTHRHPVLIIGAGRGGSALLELFRDEGLVQVIGIADRDEQAPGMVAARARGIPTYTDVRAALEMGRNYRDCLIYNLTHDDEITRQAGDVVGLANVTGGVEAHIFWQMVTELRQARFELENSQKQFQAVIQNAMDGIVVISEDGRIHAFNPAAEKIFGYTQEETLGQLVNMLMPEPTRSEHGQYLQRYFATGEKHIIGVRGRDVTAMRRSGEEFPLELSVSEMRIAEQRYFIGIVRDITERKEAEERIRHLAHHDYLTGLPNRTLFMDRLDHTLALARRNRTREALLFLDLDGFKTINDTLGHEGGDVLLQQVGLRIASVVRASDTVARLGGDEFAVILNNVSDSQAAALVAGKIIETVSTRYEIMGQPCHIGCSIGIAVYPDDLADSGNLLKHADAAMYVSKQRGKNTYSFYSPAQKSTLKPEK